MSSKRTQILSAIFGLSSLFTGGALVAQDEPGDAFDKSAKTADTLYVEIKDKWISKVSRFAPCLDTLSDKAVEKLGQEYGKTKEGIPEGEYDKVLRLALWCYSKGLADKGKAELAGAMNSDDPMLLREAVKLALCNCEPEAAKKLLEKAKGLAPEDAFVKRALDHMDRIALVMERFLAADAAADETFKATETGKAKLVELRKALAGGAKAYKKTPCPKCNGVGRIQSPAKAVSYTGRGHRDTTMDMLCPTCRGQKEFLTEDKDATGTINKDQILTELNDTQKKLEADQSKIAEQKTLRILQCDLLLWWVSATDTALEKESIIQVEDFMSAYPRLPELKTARKEKAEGVAEGIKKFSEMVANAKAALDTLSGKKPDGPKFTW